MSDARDLYLLRHLFSVVRKSLEQNFDARGPEPAKSRGVHPSILSGQAIALDHCRISIRELSDLAPADRPALLLYMRRFFIVGCQRSGTTLMRLILGSHSKVYCYDEYLAYERLRDLCACEARLYDWAGYKIPRWTEQLHDPVLSDEGHEIVARNFYSGEPILFMIRDVRDVVLSMETLKLRTHDSERSWLEEWGVRILKAKSRTPAFRDRYRRELRLASHDNHAAGALYWKFKTEAYFLYAERECPVITVKYEDLASESTAAIRRILAFLHLEEEPALFRHHVLLHPETDTQGIAIGNTDSKRPIDSASIGQWRDKLADSAVDSILRVAGDLNRIFYPG